MNNGGNGKPDAQLQEAETEEQPHHEGRATDVRCRLGWFKEGLHRLAVEKLADSNRDEGIATGRSKEYPRPDNNQANDQKCRILRNESVDRSAP